MPARGSEGDQGNEGGAVPLPNGVTVTRFAPSPTGLLHLGHAFAALNAFEAASPGGFLLRIEDLDRTRARSQFVAAIEADLQWLGLSWPQPVLRQSQRMLAYRAALATLNARALTYPCFCTRRAITAEMARAGKAPHAAEMPYPGTCRTLPHGERQRRIERGEPFAVRLDAARATAAVPALQFEELGAGPRGEHGTIAVEPARHGDIVLARKDLPAAYHLAVVIDDAFQGVTLVTRGNDLFSATHVQRLLQALLGLPAPRYAHHRLIVDQHGRRLSKRDHALTLRELRSRGLTAREIRERLGLAGPATPAAIP